MEVDVVHSTSHQHPGMTLGLYLTKSLINKKPIGKDSTSVNQKKGMIYPILEIYPSKVPLLLH